MLTPPDERVLLLAERWLKLLSCQGRAQDTLTACRCAPTLFCVLQPAPAMNTWLHS
jgi:hypothetical protein